MLRGLVFGKVTALSLILSAPSQAGSRTIKYSGGLAGTTPYQMHSDGFYGGKAMGSACGGAISVGVTWKVAYRGEEPPYVVYLREDARATGQCMALAPVTTPPNSANNGIGSDTIRSIRLDSGVIYDDASGNGFRALRQIVPKGGRFMYAREPSATGAVSWVGYRVRITEFAYQIRAGFDQTFKPGPSDEFGRATPVPSTDPDILSPRRGDTVVNTNSSWGDDPLDNYRVQERLVCPHLVNRS